MNFHFDDCVIFEGQTHYRTSINEDGWWMTLDAFDFFEEKIEEVPLMSAKIRGNAAFARNGSRDLFVSLQDETLVLKMRARFSRLAEKTTPEMIEARRREQEKIEARRAQDKKERRAR